ncbi:MAG: NADH-quinone oxidoreductase subunit J [Candidatus Omnitrophica bacterium]|nr:NADH-quinone oxidoreductase subunit J [Candidatus Omnitrophota bacterium]
MLPLEIIIKTGIYALMAVCLLGALLSVLFRNLFHAALALTGALLGIAGIYLALHADFLAMIQILIYVGAIMTLVVFAIMLTEKIGDKAIRSHSPQGWLALGGGVLLLTFLVKVIQTTPWPLLRTAAPMVSVMDLGKALLGTYVFPFEIISVVLIAALIGAIVVARKDLNS